MTLRHKFFYLICALLSSASTAFAVDLSISSLGDGRYIVNGATMDGVAGIDLTVNYDTALLSGPSISQGGLITGAMMAANTNNPGTIKVAIISTRAFSGSGQILTVSFAGRNGTGGITNINAKTIDLKGVQLQTTASVIPEAQSGSSTPQAESTYLQGTQTTTQYQPPAATSGTSPQTVATPSIGSISLPGESTLTDTPKKQEQATSSQQQEQYRPTPQLTPKPEDTRQPEPKPKQADELKKVSYVSVLERFKTYQGDRSPLILAALFSKPLDSNISQEPAVIAADGKATVKLKVRLELKEEDTAPNFAAAEAKIISLKTDEATGRWIIELMPAKGTSAATLSILAGSRLMDIPIVAVPQIKSLTFSDKEMAAFAKDFGAEKPLFDLNKDGRHNYVDDYLYAGNLLLAGKKPGAAR